MQHLTPRRRTRKEPALKEGINRGWNAATPQADKSDKIPATHSPQIWLPLT